MARSKKPSQILIIGRRWFARTYGNTYFTAEISVNGKFLQKIGPEYGYGDHYIDQAFAWLADNGHISGYDSQRSRPWRWAQDHKVNLIYSVSDVRREKDL